MFCFVQLAEYSCCARFSTNGVLPLFFVRIFRFCSIQTSRSRGFQTSPVLGSLRQYSLFVVCRSKISARSMNRSRSRSQSTTSLPARLIPVPRLSFLGCPFHL